MSGSLRLNNGTLTGSKSCCPRYTRRPTVTAATVVTAEKIKK
jgi:hypothetical protein